MPVTVDVLDGDYAVCRLPAGATVAPGMFDVPGVLISVTCTPAEVSVVCPAGLAPRDNDAVVVNGWRVLSVRGPLDAAPSGTMAAVSTALADAGVSLLAVSAVDTDHLLVRDADLATALDALRVAGNVVYGANTVRGGTEPVPAPEPSE